VEPLSILGLPSADLFVLFRAIQSLLADRAYPQCPRRSPLLGLPLFHNPVHPFRAMRFLSTSQGPAGLPLRRTNRLCLDPIHEPAMLRLSAISSDPCFCPGCLVLVFLFPFSEKPADRLPLRGGLECDRRHDLVHALFLFNCYPADFHNPPALLRHHAARHR